MKNITFSSHTHPPIFVEIELPYRTENVAPNFDSSDRKMNVDDCSRQKVKKITMPSFFPRKVTQSKCPRANSVFSFANNKNSPKNWGEPTIIWHLLVFHNKAINGPKSRMKSKWCWLGPSGPDQAGRLAKWTMYYISIGGYLEPPN